MPEEFRHITRIANTDLDGTIKVVYALTKIKGIGIRMANVIIEKSGIDPDTRLGLVPESKLDKIEEIIKNPMKYNVPNWLLNRSNDEDTGKERHLVGPDLTLQVKADIDKMKKTRSWKGFRHSYGLKVRGQRTRTTGRTKKSLGVKKKVVTR